MKDLSYNKELYHHQEMHHPMHQIECSQYLLNCVCHLREFVAITVPLPPLSFFRCPHFYHCLLSGTVGCHCDCIRSCYSCVIVADIQAETEGYARPCG